MSDYFAWLAAKTKTSWWHDSGDVGELDRALALGASGVTTNPVLVAEALRSSGHHWREELAEIGRSAAADEERGLRFTEVVVRHAAARLAPVHRGQTGGREGYVCAQVNPACVGDRAAMHSMARVLHGLAPNIAVKLPATVAGLDVAEACVAEGITVTLTVSFTVAQVLAIAEAHRRGGATARQRGIAPGRCFAVVMIGRIDDYLRDLAGDVQAPAREADIRQAGLAIVKRAYALCRERRYEIVLCVAALRGVYHMTELAGADLIMSVHPKIQKMLLADTLPEEERIARPVPPDVVARLETLADFRRAYEPGGLAPQEFLAYGATQRTLSQFVDMGWKRIESFQLPP